jgi:hypothetical protein
VFTVAKGAEMAVDPCLTEEKRSAGGETEGMAAVVFRNVLSDRHIWHYLVAYRGTLEIPLINGNPRIYR